MEAVRDFIRNQDGGCLSNSGFPGTERSLGRVYFAFKPELAVSENAVALGNHMRAKHRLQDEVLPGVLHMTICLIGQFPGLEEKRVEAARRVADRLVAKPIEIILDRVRTYPNGRETMPFVAFAGDGVPKAKLFRHALATDLRRSGFTIPRNLPDPHLTLLYDRRMVTEEPIGPMRWVARDFALIHSINGEGRHVLLGQWTLRG